ncbi:lipoprotein-releasing ABC transporter permease subunit [Neptunomonas phycophila]|jgi:lipoprotein-releasing system permease protein|uniref:Lipoprotein-releasing ABC transporter permease subunit n=1 Tax=Neptunomonas phycophila TaxID=1572645 RepID=A0AAW7XM79_9GAMM|nr:lipoprotein-releasing ABC transporter permease subunit [Neptunomonas phycophila]MBT3147385.1 lipoprotein-releasing ABC transporter permease subunit [Neptunomonas phycophila]MDO6454013.1 lipoprotein-releasing ABC transporter permease subunit [Neptunomonas phycophila]MDO6469538.1 lipoprotein-releasing ABC transporter permease subunit [Neptunomonas phycophila]MDO6785202.1 lipoprotein-releasing ABC transporter permease subunit [Neptunomonas phycophila]QLE97508.1 lipoprotein-releasing ABC transp
MFKPFSLFVGLRYTAAKRNNHFISFISLVSMLGLMLGVAALILVLSVMNGFDRELKDRILGMVPHASITGYDQPIEDWKSISSTVLDDPRVIGTAPFIHAQGMLTNAGQVRGVMVQGVDPEAEKAVSIVADHMLNGSWDTLKEANFGIVLGDLLARYLGVRMGDKVTLVLPEASISVAGVTPRLKRFTVVGIFSVGAELDSSLAYINIDDAAKIKRIPEGVEGIRLTLDDLFKAPSAVREIGSKLPGYYLISDWTRTHGNLFQAIQMEKKMIGLLLFLIVFVAAFNIVSTLVMVVTDKKSDIAILRTLGATPGMIMRIFMVQGVVIGFAGTLLGAGLGTLLALTVTDLVAWLESVLGVQFLSADVYFISYLPSQLNMSDVVLITASAMSISFLATLYPAWRASKTQPAEALRYE